MSVSIIKSKHVETIYYVNNKPVSVHGNKIIASIGLTQEEEDYLSLHISFINKNNTL